MLGRIFGLFRQRVSQGKSIQLGALEGILSPEEISRIYRQAFLPILEPERQACLDIWKYYAGTGS